METENDSSDELEIVYATLSRELAPSRAYATDDTVPLKEQSKSIFAVLRKFVYARPQVLVFVITKTKTPSEQYQSPMCLECDTSVNTFAKIADEFASVDLVLQTRGERLLESLSPQ